MAAHSKDKTKHDIQYEKRVVMTAILLTELHKGDLTHDKITDLTPSYYNYAKNDALAYLEEHKFIEHIGEGYRLSK